DLGQNDWRVTLSITPRRPVIIGHVVVRVDGAGEADPLLQRILRHLPLREGERLKHSNYESVKTELQRTAATYGYLDARLIRNELVVHPPNYRANLALEPDTGQRYRFGATSIQQKVVDDTLERRYLRYHAGD